MATLLPTEPQSTFAVPGRAQSGIRHQKRQSNGAVRVVRRPQNIGSPRSPTASQIRCTASWLRLLRRMPRRTLPTTSCFVEAGDTPVKPAARCASVIEVGRRVNVCGASDDARSARYSATTSVLWAMAEMYARDTRNRSPSSPIAEHDVRRRLLRLRRKSLLSRSNRRARQIAEPKK